MSSAAGPSRPRPPARTFARGGLASGSRPSTTRTAAAAPSSSDASSSTAAAPERRAPVRTLKQPMTLSVAETPLPGRVPVATASGVNDQAALRAALERRATAARRAEKWMDKAMEEVLTRDEFQRALSYMHAAQYGEVQHERHLNGLCSYPLCGNAPAAEYRSAKRFVVSTAKRTITETDGNADEGFCSRKCATRAQFVAAGLGTEATWLSGAGGVRVQLLEEREESGEVRWGGKRGDVLEWVKKDAGQVDAVGASSTGVAKTESESPAATATGTAAAVEAPRPPSSTVAAATGSSSSSSPSRAQEAPTVTLPVATAAAAAQTLVATSSPAAVQSSDAADAGRDLEAIPATAATSKIISSNNTSRGPPASSTTNEGNGPERTREQQANATEAKATPAPARDSASVPASGPVAGSSPGAKVAPATATATAAATVAAATGTTPPPPTRTATTTSDVNDLIASLSIVERETPAARPKPPSRMADNAPSAPVPQGRIVSGGTGVGAGAGGGAGRVPLPLPAVSTSTGPGGRTTTSAPPHATRRKAQAGSSLLSGGSQKLASAVLAAASKVRAPPGQGAGSDSDAESSAGEEDWAKEMGWGGGAEVDALFEEARVAREMEGV